MHHCWKAPVETAVMYTKQESPCTTKHCFAYFFHPMSPCFLPLFLLHSEMWMLIFSYRSWVFPLLHPTVSGSVSLPWLPPCPSSWSVTRKLWTAPTVGFPSFSSPKCSFPHPYPATCTSRFFFPRSPPFLYLSHVTSFLFPSLWNPP